MRAARALAIISALAAVVAGCSATGPSFDEAAAELQKDVQRLETSDVFKNRLLQLRILQRADKDVPCDQEKFRRVLRATADEERVDEPVDSRLDRAQRLIEDVLVRDFGYELMHDLSQLDAEDGRFIYGKKEEFALTVTAYVAPESPTWRLHIMTDCLSR